MASGTISLGTSGKLTGQLVWSSSSNGSVANSSSVTIKIQAKKTSSSEETTGTWKGTAQIGNYTEEYSYYGSISASWITVKTYTKTIEHQDSGYQDVYLFGSVTGPSGTTLAGKTVGQGKSVVLDQIPRASELWGISNFTLDNSIPILITKHSSSFTDTLTISLNGTTIKTINNITDGYEVSFASSELTSIYSKLPNATTGTFIFTLTTKSGSTTLGTSTKTATGTIPTSIKPKISNIAITEASGVVPSSWGVFVKNKSKLKFVINATAGTGASISSITTTINGTTYSGSEITTNPINTSGGVFYEVRVTDSRGRPSSSTNTINIVDYGNPYVTSASAIRCDAQGNFNDNGIFLKVNLTAGVSSINGNNTAKFQIYYKKTTDSSWNIRTIDTDDLTYDGSVMISSIDTNSSYDVQIVVDDYFTRVIKLLPTISTAFTTVDYLNGGHGIAFGKVAEEEDLMDINFNVKFNKDFKGLSENTESTSTTKPYSCDYINQFQKGTIIYENSSGSTGTLITSEASANFRVLEIFYFADGVFDSVRIEPVDGRRFSITLLYSNATLHYQYIFDSLFVLNGTSLTWEATRNNFILDTNEVNSYGSTPYINIYKVVGYR